MSDATEFARYASIEVTTQEQVCVNTFLGLESLIRDEDLGKNYGTSSYNYTHKAYESDLL